MSSELDPLLIVTAACWPPILSGHLFTLAVLSAALLALCLCLSHGGLAWALSRPPHRAVPIYGPSGVPFLGLASAFSSGLTHRILQKLAAAFDATKLMSFSVGFTRFIISSDPETARELLNSTAFADRPVKESAYELLFHRAMGFAPYGEYWRNLRRISATHLFSPRRIAASGLIREKIVAGMVAEIENVMSCDGEVEIRRILHYGALNNVMMSVFGVCYDFNGEDGAELEALVSEGYELLGVFNWSDHFPILGWLDCQGVRKRCRKLAARVNVFVGNIIKQHKKNLTTKKCDDESGDFVDVLLDLQKENRISDSDMVAVLWEMIFRGTDTVAILLEWILARMVLHPDIQTKARSEIELVVGRDRAVAGADLPNLAYLRCIVKETLRLHPPGPLLSWARLAIHDTCVGPHFVPAGTTAMVNMWAITHDPQVWTDPNEFKPERFLKEDVSIMGSDLRLAPFGSGRRVCPGKGMGLATVEVWVAQLIQSFKWVGGDVQLSERLKLSMEMEHSLVCKPIFLGRP